MDKSVGRYSLVAALLFFSFFTFAYATSIGTNISVSGNLNVVGNATTTNATTTDLYVSGIASTTNLYSTGLVSCNGGSNALTWSAGIFGCNTISGGGGNTYSSTTIGDSTQIGGLTISGGATTTGNAYFAGSIEIATTTPIQVNNSSGLGNADVSVSGILGVSGPGVHQFIKTGNFNSDVMAVMNQSVSGGDSIGQSAIDFQSNPNRPGANGVWDYVGAIGYSDDIADTNFDQYSYWSFSPPGGFAEPNFNQASSGVGGAIISQEGVYNGSYSRRRVMIFDKDWGISFEDPTGNKMIQISSPLSSSGNYAYGADELKVIGSNAYKANVNPGTNGGASAQFTAVNSDNDAVVVASFPSQENYHAYPPHGGSLTAYGSGGLSLFAANGSGKLHFYTGGDSSSNLQATIDSSGNLGLGQATPNAKLDINSSSIILESSATPSSSSATCTTGTIEWDSSYVYVCVSTNTWKRAALSTW